MVVVSNSFDAPTEGILLETPGTKLIVNDQEVGTATLYITENNVVWGGGTTPSGNPASTLSLLYPTISLHAIQREPSPALYMMLNYQLRMPELHQTDSIDQEDDEDFDADIEPTTQLRFVPANENLLQAMYNALTTGQSLHPDPADQQIDEEDDYMDGEDDDEDEAFEDAEESETGAGGDAAARLARLRLHHANGQHAHGNGNDNGDSTGNTE